MVVLDFLLSLYFRPCPLVHMQLLGYEFGETVGLSSALGPSWASRQFAARSFRTEQVSMG